MSSSRPAHLAIDLGAGGGRAILGAFDETEFQFDTVHRFQYGVRRVAGHDRWDFNAVLEGIRTGIRRAKPVADARGRRLASVGVDSWGVDYGLLDDAGRLVEDPIAYRDPRTRGLMEVVFGKVSRFEIFHRTGIQFLELNTLYQLVAHVRDGLPENASKLLLIPDLCHHMLCGSLVTERSNASTTQLLGTDGVWDRSLFDRLNLPLALMPSVMREGTPLGPLLPDHQVALDADALIVIAPATHDTASAVVGTPLERGDAYISSGTWSLVGVERTAPLMSEAAALANFTNEAGACGTTRFLKNVMGLWMLEACRREWNAAGLDVDYATLFDRMNAIAGCVGLVFPDDPRFFNPPSMNAEIRAALAEHGQPVHHDPVLIAKVILDSLALRYASVLASIESVTGESVRDVHIVGGGSQNWYLNQATADASCRCVLAGPVEATGVGNITIQALAAGEVSSIAEARQALSRTVRSRRFVPRGSRAWADAIRRYEELVTR